MQPDVSPIGNRRTMAPLSSVRHGPGVCVALVVGWVVWVVIVLLAPTWLILLPLPQGDTRTAPWPSVPAVVALVFIGGLCLSIACWRGQSGRVARKLGVSYGANHLGV